MAGNARKVVGADADAVKEVAKTASPSVSHSVEALESGARKEPVEVYKGLSS